MFKDPLLKQLEKLCREEGEVDFSYWLRKTLREAIK